MVELAQCKLLYVSDLASISSVLLLTFIDTIDKDSYEIKKEDDEVLTTIEDLSDELPPNSPRFVLLCYPYKTDDGRLVSPLVLLYWKPATCGQQSKMLYAGAVELFRGKAGVAKMIQIEDEEELEDIEKELK